MLPISGHGLALVAYLGTRTSSRCLSRDADLLTLPISGRGLAHVAYITWFRVREPFFAPDLSSPGDRLHPDGGLFRWSLSACMVGKGLGSPQAA